MWEIRIRQGSLPIIAAALFLLVGSTASATLWAVIVPFARDVDLHPALLLAVPALFAALWALLLFQGALRHIEVPRQALSRGILVVLLTWLSFAALAAAVWASPQDYWDTLSRVLVLSGIMGGAQMLGGAVAVSLLLARLVSGYRNNVRIHP